jgi:8-oxo-dGTP diphosphatase
LRWVREADVDSLPLHPGFGSSWPELRTAPVPAETEDLQAGDPHTVVLEDGGFGWLSGSSHQGSSRQGSSHQGSSHQGSEQSGSDQNLSEASSTQS